MNQLRVVFVASRVGVWVTDAAFVAVLESAALWERDGEGMGG